jgi:hypothetical protein
MAASISSACAFPSHDGSGMAEMMTGATPLTQARK